MTDVFHLPFDTVEKQPVETLPKRTREATHTTKPSKRRKRQKVGARVLLLNGISQLLLVKERKTGKWNSPGGSKENHETAQECAIREMREECGIDLNQPDFTCVGAQEKREGSAVDRTRADREETQVRSKTQRATLNRAGSMRRRAPAPNEFEERAALASAGLPTSFTSR
eukprot:COSAG01_NODE_15883_length_1286_cov_12.513877_1_plen_170_part_00